MDTEGGKREEKFSKSGRKRARSAVYAITDQVMNKNIPKLVLFVMKILICICSLLSQVVPFEAPCPCEKAAFLMENDEVGGKMNLEGGRDSMHSEHHSLLLKDQQPNDPNSVGG